MSDLDRDIAVDVLLDSELYNSQPETDVTPGSDVNEQPVPQYRSKYITHFKEKFTADSYEETAPAFFNTEMKKYTYSTLKLQ